MKVFESYHSYYNFISSIFSQYRYIPTKSTEQFLQTLLETCDDRIISLETNTVLYRSQKGCDQIEHDGQLIVLPYKAERMLPKAEKVRNGRVNSLGIPVLYLSDDIETAISEARPWLHERISIAELKLKRMLTILDLSKIEKKTSLFLGEPNDPNIINKNVWADVSNAFSMPVNIEDQDISYIPTQIIGEFFRSHRFDGIKYKSLLSKGNNYALFDTFCAEMVNGKVLSVKSIKIEVDQYGNNVTYQDNGNKILYSFISEFSKVDS